MSEKVEQVARAIKWSRVKDEVASTNYMTGITTFMRDIASERTIDLDQSDLDAARAAIEELLEPDKQMIEVGNTALDDATDSGWDSDPDGESRNEYTTIRSTAPFEIFQAMMKAALIRNESET